MRQLLILLSLFVCASSLASESDTSSLDTLTVKPVNVPEWFVMDGQLEPVDKGTVSAQTSGRVSAITVDVNDVVPMGHLLIEITNTSQTAGLDQAKAAVKAAEARFTDAERRNNFV